ARTVLPRERPDRPPGAAGDRRPSRGRPAAHGQRGRGALGRPAHRCHRHRELDPLPRELCMTHRPGETVNAHIVSPIISPRVTPYPLSAVDVADDSVFAAARGRMLDLARELPRRPTAGRLPGERSAGYAGSAAARELGGPWAPQGGCLERARLSGARRG